MRILKLIYIIDLYMHSYFLVVYTNLRSKKYPPNIQNRAVYWFLSAFSAALLATILFQ